jgi:hypothetical protein
MSVLLKVDTYRRLGLTNIAQVAWYIFRLKTGWFKKTLPIESPVQGDFFEFLAPKTLLRLQKKYSNQILLENPSLFGWIEMDNELPPNWQTSVLSGKSISNTKQHWSEVSDFDSGVGDIKGVWEASRFSWAVLFVQQYLKNESTSSLQKVNQWIQNWSLNNPANQGVNWKCAQEASLRILHLSACALLLEQKKPTESLALFITEHLRRIFPTLGYAKAQDNNHGTSEAAALFIGGSWLLTADKHSAEAKKWQAYGRRYLSERVNKLIMPDGSFSQYSATYHRLMLDTLSLVELWRRFLSLDEFTNHYLQRVQKATFWLSSVTDPAFGDVPNLGANDGAHILNFANVGYRDFRPTVELANQLFNDCSVFSSDGCKFVVQLFDLQGTLSKQPPVAIQFVDGGYATLYAKDTWCLLRVPTFKFRPGQADCLHLDLWCLGENLLTDAGSFSYNTEQKWLDYFSGVEGHNTVQFDDRQPMPKVSRFLYGKWPKFKHFVLNQRSVMAEYTDWKNATHRREVELQDKQIIITDYVSGNFEQACLRWRLNDKEWKVQKNTLKSETMLMSVTATENIDSFNLAQGSESRYYAKKVTVPVLEIRVSQSTQITTTISWT